jgi:hypothetical protein
MDKIAMCYLKILNNICKCPLPILSSAQALAIEGVGPNMAKKFEEVILAKESSANGKSSRKSNK